MATTIAEHFTGELETWNQHITSYRHEMQEMKRKLSEVIARNTIPNIAERVEDQQQKLDAISIKFFQLRNQFQKHKPSLQQNGGLIDDSMIREEIEKRQFALRRIMQQSEKKYVQIKHECSNFLSDTLKRHK